MTVDSNINSDNYLGNGSTTVFPYTFKVFAVTDLLVTKQDLAGQETVLVLGADYTVPGFIADATGSITLAVALPGDGTEANSYKLNIARSLTALQPADFTSQGTVRANIVERALDRSVMLIQQLEDKLSRSITVPITDTGSSLELPPKALRASSQVIVDSEGNITTGSVPSSGVISAAMQPVTAASTLPIARANMDPNQGEWLVKATGSSYARSLSSRAADHVNVKDSGAVGNGIANDSAAFAAAASSGSSGDNIYIEVPPGVYYLNASWTFSGKGVVIRGAGPRQTILRFYGCDGIVHSGDFTLDIANIGIETDGNGTHVGIQYGVSTSVVTQDTFRARNVNLWGVSYGSNYWSSAIVLNDCGNTWIDRVTIIGKSSSSPNYGGRGVRILSSIAKPSTGHHFTRCTMNYLSFGVDIIASNYPSIEGIRFHFCGFVGVNIGISFDASGSGYQPPLFTLFESHIDLAANGTNPVGVKLKSVSQIDIKGCDLYSYCANGVALWLDNCTQTFIHGSHFIGGSFANMSAILLDNNTTITSVDDCSFMGGFTNGIYVLAASLDWNRETGCRFSGVATEVNDGTGKFIRYGKSKVRVKLTVPQTITTATPTAISWATADTNVASTWLIGSPTRLTIPSGVVSVRFSITVRFASNATGYRQVLLRKNGGFALSLPICSAPPVNGAPTDITISSRILDTVAGDYFEAEVTQTSGGNLDLSEAVTYMTMDIIRVQ